MTNTTQSIERLNGSNYTLWKLRMRMVLTKERTWNIASGKTKAPSTPSADDENAKIAFDDWNTKDQDALASISLAVSDSELSNIMECEHAFEAWSKLESIYQVKDVARTLYLR